MKFWKKLLAAQLSVTMLTGAAAVVPMNMTVAAAVDEESASTDGTTGECKWRFDSDTRTLTVSGKGKMADYENATQPWDNLSVLNVVLEDGVTYVGSYAFFRQKVAAVTMADSVTEIGDAAFCDTNLTDITWSNNLAAIGSYAFSNVHIKTLTLPPKVSSLGENAFSNNYRLAAVTIPDGCTCYLSASAFYYCNVLKSVSIGKNVAGAHDSSFQRCPVEWYTVAADNAFLSSGSGHLFNKDSSKLIFYANGRTNTETTLSSRVTELGDYAFADNASMQTVTLSANLKRIGAYSFANTNITSIQFGSKLEQVSETAFQNCPWLQNQPEGLVYAGNVAYLYKGTCPETVTIKEGTTVIGGHAFAEQTALKTVVLPSTLKDIQSYAFTKCTALTEAVLPNGLTKIGEGAFGVCKALPEIILPDTVTTLGKLAFYDCSSAKTLHLSESLSEIPVSVFYGCTALTGDIVIPASVASIGDRCFYNDTNIRSFTFQGADTVIDGYPLISYHFTVYAPVGSAAEAHYRNLAGTKFIAITLAKGDVNFDGKVNVHDVTDVQRAAAEYITLSPQALINADVTQNGKADIEDATAIQRGCAEFTSSL